MNIIIRADASIQIGTGHLMRCLTLANELRSKGIKASFVCRELPGNLCNFIENKGYSVYRLPDSRNVTWQTDAEQTKAILNEEQDADWLIVDHYALDRQWELQMKPHVKKIMVIDDLADRPHHCDLLLDQNLYFNQNTRYDELVPDYCKKLLGPKYACCVRNLEKLGKV
jgi:UDP-2,4-diacetamido-2,4,6-trideoxy-beta-L-altropyranose hydrolase